MKKLKNLTIENFQSHERTSIDFDDSFTVIVGASDQGKSAIIRALKWVLFNEPQGEEFIRAGASEVRVALTLSDGTIIIRERGRKNRYILRQGKEERPFESFGRGVPEEIINAHEIKPVKLDENQSLRLSLSEQLDGPFLLSESKPTKAKTIGFLSGVNIIDQAIRDTTLDIKQLMSEEKGIRENISRINEELKGFDDLKSMEELLPYLKERYGEATALKDRIEKLNSLKGKLDRIDSEINLNMKIIKSLSNLSEIEKKGSEVDVEFKMYDNLSKAHDRLQDIQKRILASSAILEKTGEVGDALEKIKDLADLSNRLKHIKDCQTRLDTMTVRLKKCETNLNKLKTYEAAFTHLNGIESSLDRLKLLNERYVRLSRINNDLKDASMKEERARKEKEGYLAGYEKLLKSMGKCPVCGSEIDDHTAERIIAELR
ncbi:MAG: AAA family ATPase [Thermoanaerobacteraceae bacterium]|nr:AAA family ATPase [Thermoanaerobacteraceae bacterium]